ncbi:MAG: MFS transporter [Pseudomonadota bacterium]
MTPPPAAAPQYLSRGQEFALMVTAAVVTANAYYIHPIIGEVAAHFAVSEAQIGIVPALNQLALALGILLLLPLGDRYSNKVLCLIFVSAQALFMLGMALAQDFASFIAASTALGFVTIAPYLIPAFASKRVAPQRLGQVTALLTAGVIFGILVARVGAGVVAEYYGWRAVYWCAFGVMAGVTVFLPLTLKSEQAPAKRPQGSYGALLVSVFALARQNREMVFSAVMQACNFASFTITWLALALHLTSDEMGYGVDVVGYLAAIAVVSIIATPRLGRLADRIGARRARAAAAAVQLIGVILLYPLGWSVWWIIVPLFIVNLVGPTIDVTGRMLFLTQDPQIRTRLTTSYIVMMFIGGAVGSMLGTAIYDWGGWAATCALLLAISATILFMSLLALRIWGGPERREAAVTD